MSTISRLQRYCGFFVLLLVVFNTEAASRAEPEPASGWKPRARVTAQQFMVVTAHPQATKAGYKVLERGGSAVDAAVAIQAMLTLVEPQSSGIGGGAFMLYWDAQSQRLSSYDGRETAPMAANGDLFLDQQGKPLAWQQALVGGRSVGVPGVLRMLELAHQQHGKRPWSELFDSSIALARQGFEVGPRLHKMLVDETNPGLKRYPQARDYFYPGGLPLQVGALRANPELADTLAAISEKGADYLYSGPLARQIVDRVRGADGNPGLISLADLAGYQAKIREPLCGVFFQYRVCSMAPPTSGGVGVLQILGMMEQLPLSDLQPDGVAFAHLLTQASRLAYADRERYLADSDFIEVPLEQLLSKAYLAGRAQLIDPQRDMEQVQAGVFEGFSYRQGHSWELPSTSHFVVVDGEGNAVSMTTSIEMAFGSTLMVGGFLLNNQLTDFSFVAERNGHPVANRVEAGKRPRSSMAPVMVFDLDRQLTMLAGSPGGSRIINYVAQLLLQTLVWDLPIELAVTQPHISNRNGVTELEDGTSAVALKPLLEARGHQVKVRPMNSGIHALIRDSEQGWRAGIDPRREGSALGR